MAKKLKRMADLEREMSELAHIRTELSEERTALSYLRTAAQLILFGLAFVGFRQQALFFVYVGVSAVVIGLIFIIIAGCRGLRHRRRRLGAKSWRVSLFNNED